MYFKLVSLKLRVQTRPSKRIASKLQPSAAEPPLHEVWQHLDEAGMGQENHRKLSERTMTLSPLPSYYTA